jgi:hypothetical protein
VRELNVSHDQQFKDAVRKNKKPIFPSTARDTKYYIEVEAKKSYKSNKNGTVAVKWNAGIISNKNTIHVYTEFLEMFHR